MGRRLVSMRSIDDEVSSHALIGGGAKVRVIAAGDSWAVRDVKSALKEAFKRICERPATPVEQK